MEKWKGKVVVVTGASAGIGAAISIRLVNEGLHVVGLARRKERLEQLESDLNDTSGKFVPLVVDVTKEDELLNGFKWIVENVGPVHALVNNAGIVRDTNLIDGKNEDFKAVLDTNILSIAIATREAINIMRKNDISGQIININSLAGSSVPNLRNFNLYPASKHALTAYTQVLRDDLNRIGSRIKVSSLSPGATDSEICETNNADGAFKEDFNKGPRLKCEDVADAICYILSLPETVQVQELTIVATGQNL